MTTPRLPPPRDTAAFLQGMARAIALCGDTDRCKKAARLIQREMTTLQLQHERRCRRRKPQPKKEDTCPKFI